MSRKMQSLPRKTFNEMLAERVETHAGVLLEKARLYSHIAKSAASRSSRRLAYRCKTQCIRHLLAHCSPVAQLRHDRASHDWGLLIVRVVGHGGLHTHRRWLDAA